MGYLYLAGALAACAVKGFCGKKQSAFVSGVRDAALVNLLRLLCCAAVGAVLLTLGDGFGALAVGKSAMAVTVLSGAANAVMLITWLLAVKRSAYMLLDVFATLGVIVPMLVCRFLYGEAIRPVQWAGFALLCAAVLVMCSYSMKIKGKRMTAADILLLTVFGLSGGTADLTQKLFVHSAPDGSKAAFNFYTFAFAAAILAVLLCFLWSKEKAPCPLGKVWYYIVIMALALFITSYGKTAAAAILPAVQVYPLFQGGILILSSLMAAVFFGEKLTKQSVLGIAMCFGALLIINML